MKVINYEIFKDIVPVSFHPYYIEEFYIQQVYVTQQIFWEHKQYIMKKFIQQYIQGYL